LKLIAGVGETLSGRLMILDALAMQWRTIKLAKDPACPVCAQVTA
jgi:adenylyltransferase/sulfurtransferase